LIDIILLKVLLKETTRKKENAGLSDSLSTFNEMEKAGDNPQVSFKPVMCQHCNHAPCETVCPVAASYIVVKVKIIWHIIDVLVLVIVLITVL
jgi:Fe-S-cluster-containing dehydrogenase component